LSDLNDLNDFEDFEASTIVRDNTRSPLVPDLDAALLSKFFTQATGIVEVKGTECHVADAGWMLVTDKKKPFEAII
jgi:hypothetical protein